MNTEDAIKQKNQQLERLEAERTEKLAAWKKTISEAKGRGVRGVELERLQDQQSTYNQLSRDAIIKTKEEIDGLKADLTKQQAEQQASARTRLEKSKQEYHDAWIANGGTEDSFKAAWPEMESDILKGLVTEQVTTQPKPRIVDESLRL